MSQKTLSCWWVFRCLPSGWRLYGGSARRCLCCPLGPCWPVPWWCRYPATTSIRATCAGEFRLSLLTGPVRASQSHGPLLWWCHPVLGVATPSRMFPGPILNYFAQQLRGIQRLLCRWRLSGKGEGKALKEDVTNPKSYSNSCVFLVV